MDDLSAVGFDLSNLGGGSYAINGIPSGIEGLNPVELVRNMLHTAMEKGNDVKEEIQNILALTLARAAAIVYGQVLSNEEMVSLVDNLFACPSPNYTPDGKTVLTGSIMQGRKTDRFPLRNWAWIKSEFLMPKKIVFLPDNLYYKALKPTIEAHEKGLPAVPKKQRAKAQKKPKKAKKRKEVDDVKNA